MESLKLELLLLFILISIKYKQQIELLNVTAQNLNYE